MKHRYGDYGFEFKEGVVNGKPKMFVQVYRMDAIFSVVEQGWFDPYVYRFKFPGWKDIPKDLEAFINQVFVSTQRPEKKAI